jgi:Tfp pilus assembly protein PilF
MLRLGDGGGSGCETTDRARTMLELGTAQLKAGDLSNAHAMFLGALEQDSSSGLVWEALASSSLRYGQPHTNLSALRRAVAENPDNPGIITNLGVALWRENYLDEAEAMFMRCLDMQPDNPDFHRNLGLVRYKQIRSKEAVEHLLIAHRAQPDNAETTSDLSIAVLQSGDMQWGMELHEVRWKILSKSIVWDMKLERWYGQPLGTDAILVHHEQGMGDSICWSRYIRWIKEHNPDCTVWFVCPPCLVNLFDGQLGIDKVLDWDQPRQMLMAQRECKWHVPLMSLLQVTGATFEQTPSDGKPYLRPPSSPGGRRAYRTPGTKLSVGVIWSSSPGQGLSRAKTVPLSDIVRLTEVPGVRLYSLQHAGTPELEGTGAKYVINDLQASFNNFADLANIMVQMDVIVAACTGPSHLAGALGVPVLLMDPYTPCWRYVPSGTKRWYGSMTSIRQSDPHRWDDVIDRIKYELRGMIDAEYHH